MPKFLVERDIPGAGAWTPAHIAPSADLIREPATRGGFPANRIAEIRAAMDPTTAEG